MRKEGTVGDRKTPKRSQSGLSQDARGVNHWHIVRSGRTKANRAGKRTQFSADGKGRGAGGRTGASGTLRANTRFLGASKLGASQRRTGTLSGASSQARRTLPAKQLTPSGSTPPGNQGGPPCESPAWPPGPRQGWAAGSDRFWLLELRVSRTFLDQLRPQLFRSWIPNSMRCQHFPSSIGPFLAARTPRFSDFSRPVAAPASQAMETQLGGTTSTVDRDDSPRSCSTNNPCR